MTFRFPISLINILLTGLLFIAAPAYAEPDLSLTEGHNLFTNDNLLNNSVNSSTNVALQDMLFEKGLDKYLRYDIGVHRTDSIKVHSSLGLQLRTEISYLQFKMEF